MKEERKPHLGSHLTEVEIAKLQEPQKYREKHISWAKGKAERHAILPPRTPQPETLERGLGTETQIPEVISRERARDGYVEIARGARERGMPRAGEWRATNKGTQEEVSACRRSKVSLLGRARGGGADRCKNIFLCADVDSWKAGLWAVRHLLFGLWVMGPSCMDCWWWHLLCRVSTMGRLLCGLQVVGVHHCSHLRLQRLAWPTTTKGP